MYINLCELFEVADDEVFLLDKNRYKVMNNSLYIDTFENDKWVTVNMTLEYIKSAKFERVPFVPRVSEKYWTIEDMDAVSIFNSFDSYDIRNIKIGLCYRTEQEAREKGIPLMQQWLKELGGE